MMKKVKHNMQTSAEPTRVGGKTHANNAVETWCWIDQSHHYDANAAWFFIQGFTTTLLGNIYLSSLFGTIFYPDSKLRTSGRRYLHRISNSDQNRVINVP